MKPIIPDAALQQHIAVLGKTRSGKSSVLRGLIEGLLDRELPVCIVDPKGDWWGIKLARDGKRPGYPVVIFGGEHADVPINAHAGAHVAELFATGNRPCLIDLGGWMVGERTRFYIDFASTLFKLTKGMRWLAIDEVHNFAPKGKVMDPEAGKALHWTNRLASEGLGKGLPMLFASQRPQKVHNDTLTSAETLIAMRVLHPSDRGAVSDWIKGCGDLELGAKVLNSLAQMDRGEGWVWSPEIGLGPERVKFPMFKTYDSFRPQTAEDAAGLKGWAAVDLDEVKTKLAKVVHEAQANDPKLLRAALAAAQVELAKLSKSKVLFNGANAADLAAEYTRGRGDGHDAGRLFERTKIVDGLKVARMAISNTHACASDAVAAMAEALDNLPAIDAVPATVGQLAVKRPTPPRPREALQRAPAAQPVDGVTGPQQRILDALAWCEAVGLPDADRTQLALLAKASPTSSTYANNLGALRNALGLVEYLTGQRIRLTTAGRAAARAPEVIPTSEDLHRFLERELPGPQWRIVAQLVKAYPEAIDKTTLADQVDASVSSSTFANNLGALRTLGLIDYPKPGDVVALPVLFLER